MQEFKQRKVKGHHNWSQKLLKGFIRYFQEILPLLVIISPSPIFFYHDTGILGRLFWYYFCPSLSQCSIPKQSCGLRKSVNCSVYLPKGRFYGNFFHFPPSVDQSFSNCQNYSSNQLSFLVYKKSCSRYMTFMGLITICKILPRQP